MTEAEELQIIAEQNLDSPSILGRIVSRLRKNNAYSQKHKDGFSFDLFWRNAGPYWRCTISLDKESEDALAQIDVHEDGTVRTELHEPGSITVAPAENLLVVVRFGRVQD
ncbi:hypothetical protein [Granulicella sp. S156]|uniref:hypothetical protein n=1 Tax=Granulicella sp. S156 TaxID=1747224 RepID=UPI00131CDBE6|nr:hypothetical protein [Granulicella sp. S156]